MEYLTKKDNLFDLIAPAVEGLGYAIVELSSRIVQRQLHVFLVIFKADGVGLQDCADVSRTIQPRLEMAEENRDVHLEVSSPGLSRKMKSADEFAIFQGRGVQYLMENEDEWSGGILGPADAKEVEISEGDNVVKLPIDQIRKIKLDDTQEVRR